MPNTFAYLVLLAWPLVVIVMFRRMAIERALIWSILGGYLLLPPAQANFNLPMVPALDKLTIPNLTAFLVITLMLRRRVPLVPPSWLVRGLLVLFVLGPVFTALNNAEPIRFASGQLPGLRLYDAVAAVVHQALFILPFFMARTVLATPRALRELTLALMLAGLFYSIPMLIEIRLSPQLNIWIYGFFQHSFEQMIRFGGYRPIVFLPHGLWMAFFALMSLIAALALMRAARLEQRPALVLACLWLAFMLVMCRSVGPLLMAVGLVPLVLLAGRKLQLTFAAVMGLIALSYPLLRGGDLVPIDHLLALAEMIAPERAQSLLFRFENEEMLLAHANAKPFFGWGGWGRHQVHDMVTGARLTVSDGRWIIVIGSYGWIGYIVEFGLLTFPLALLFRRMRHYAAADLSPFLGPLALMLGANMIDLLPNATLIPLTWLLAGALLGHAEAMRPQPVRGRSAPASVAQEKRPRTVL